MSFKIIVGEQSFVVMLHWKKTGIWNGLSIYVPPVSHTLLSDLPHDFFHIAFPHMCNFLTTTPTFIQDSYSVVFGIKAFFMYFIVLCNFNFWITVDVITDIYMYWRKYLNFFLYLLSIGEVVIKSIQARRTVLLETLKNHTVFVWYWPILFKGKEATYHKWGNVESMHFDAWNGTWKLK